MRRSRTVPEIPTVDVAGPDEAVSPLPRPKRRESAGRKSCQRQFDVRLERRLARASRGFDFLRRPQLQSVVFITSMVQFLTWPKTMHRMGRWRRRRRLRRRVNYTNRLI